MSSNSDLAALYIQNSLPSYVTPGSWKPWNPTSLCPRGFVCQEMAGQSLGMFSCDELRRIAREEYGFGDVLAGIWCPLAYPNAGWIRNCPAGSYCPDSNANLTCPAGKFCDYKTSSLTLEGGAVPCQRCNAGVTSKTLSREQKITSWVVFSVLCFIVVIRIIRRYIMIDKEKVFSALHVDSVVGAMRGEGDLQRVSHKQEQEKYAKLRPKLELIAERLRRGSCCQIENEDANNSTPPQDDILYISKSGDIMFNANAFFDILDKNKDGVLSFTELNEVMCLGDNQLKAFIANMQARRPHFEQKSTAHLDTVSRDTFVRCFLDALADAANLEPTPEEAERLFLEIAGEVGSTPTSRRRGLRSSFKSSMSTPLLSIPVERLHMSPTLTSFLSDMQIYGIVSRFKKKQREEGVKVGEISQEEFVEHYPRFLGEVTRPDFTSSFVTPNKAEGLDVTFQHLSLAVKVGKAQVNVLDDVSGRFCSNTMVAVMGGTGSGKSSLLNALCGRAYYGKVSGKVFVNGNESKIEDQQAVIGFVPQEDIVYPDLTVKENLLYAGRLTLPAGTRREEIAELADEVMASLGLSRIANSLVGDARRRGISGGEKKRVNVGIELMKRPRLLFLDEPTSGLDARAAFLVMESLKRLVYSQGTTVVAVIHQPRTDIYDMFDSLMLLGIGGKTVYHGPATKCRDYFEKMGYTLKEGESQADWFLDISSGDIEVDDSAGTTARSARKVQDFDFFGNSFEVTIWPSDENDTGLVLGQAEGVERGNFLVKEVAPTIRYATATSAEKMIQVGDKVIGVDGRSLGQLTLDEATALLKKHGDSSYVYIQLVRIENEQLDSFDTDIEVGGESRPLNPSNQDAALVKSQLAREKLYRQWVLHFEALSHLPLYNPPDASPLPIAPKQVPGWRQLFIQVRRNSLLSWRNKDARLIDAGILIIAIFLITLLVGHNLDFNRDPRELLWFNFIVSAEEAARMLPVIFQYSMNGIGDLQQYSLMASVILSVLIGLSATKIITEKQLQFFREAQSGVSATPYYLAANITSTVEQGSIAILASVIAYLITLPGTSISVFIWNFFMVSWLAVSWAIFLSLILPPNAVVVAVGAWMAFFGLLFSGLLPPGDFWHLYNSTPIAVIGAFVNPTRFFVEGIAVSAAKCLPVQSGFPAGEDAFNRTAFERSYPYFQWKTYMAHTDLDNAETFGCNGWYWWVGASICIGISIRIAGLIAIHTVGRAKQGKKPFFKEVAADFQGRSIFKSFILRGIFMFVALTGFVVLSGWLILRENV